MQTKPKSNSVITHSVNEGRITFVVKDAGELVLDMGTVSATVKERATLHGFIQRVCDAAAISRNVETGLPASTVDKFNAMNRLVEHYMSGSDEWSPTRAAGSGGDGLLLQCLVQLHPDKDRDALKKWASELNAKQRTALLNEPTVKAIADELRAKSVANVDTSGLLDSLNSLG